MERESVIIIFNMPNKNINVDLEVPLSISANDLVIALNYAYDLGINTLDINECYLKSENPIALLKGNKSLREFGIRNGSIVCFTKRG